MAVSVGPGLPALSQAQATLPPAPVAAPATDPAPVATSLYADLGLGSGAAESAGLRSPRSTQEAALLLAMAEIALDQTLQSSSAARRQGALASLRASILTLGSLEQQITRSADELTSRGTDIQTAKAQLAASQEAGSLLDGRIADSEARAARYDEFARSIVATIDALKAEVADLGDADPDRTASLNQSIAMNERNLSQIEGMRTAYLQKAETLRGEKAENDRIVAQRTAAVSDLTVEVETLAAALTDMRALSRQMIGALIAAFGQTLVRVLTGTGPEGHETVRNAVLDLGFEELERIAGAHDAASLDRAEADTEAMRGRAEAAAARRAERLGAGLAAGVADALASLAALIAEEAEASREAFRPTERVRLAL